MSDQPKKKKVILLVGLPRSGKSTWARRVGVPIVNPDSVRLALHGQAFIVEAEPMVWSMAQYMLRALLLAGHDHVIVDATNTSVKRREMWISRTGEWETYYRHIDTPLDVCISRAGDNQPLIEAIHRMNNSYEPVTIEEGIHLLEEVWN